ncbi:MAG: TonB-dependent receptor, partial [Halioglobus sp.]|nr:TonB-dependent receptor [Halioglobus sp.]
HLDDAMTYLSYSTGFRSGGVAVGNGDFDGDGIIDLENYKPETVDMIELGFKVDGFARRLRANTAIFYEDYRDIQLTTTRPDPALGVPLPAIENAGKAEIWGVEIEYTALPTDNLRLSGSIAYLHAEYKEYLAEAPDPDSGDQIQIDRADEPMPRAPKWTAHLAADYRMSTPSWGNFTPTLVIRYSDDIYGGFDRASFLVEEEVTIPAETFYDARVAWDLPDDRTTVIAWCKNITDKDNHLQTIIPTVEVARTMGIGYAPPRTYGIDLIYRFGAD